MPWMHYYGGREKNISSVLELELLSGNSTDFQALSRNTGFLFHLPALRLQFYVNI